MGAIPTWMQPNVDLNSFAINAYSNYTNHLVRLHFQFDIFILSLTCMGMLYNLHYTTKASLKIEVTATPSSIVRSHCQGMMGLCRPACRQENRPNQVNSVIDCTKHVKYGTCVEMCYNINAAIILCICVWGGGTTV